MLEPHVTQGAGLHCIAAPAVPRVITIASHGDPQDELLLLWHLCSTLTGFGYPLAVLDATSTESVDNPGLDQLLDDAFWHRDASTDQLSWSIVPAANGFKRLSRQAEGQDQSLHRLGGLFQNFGVVVIYAHVETLISLLPDSGIEPLLTVSSAPLSRVTAYQALKQLLLNAGLRSTIVSFMREPVQGAANGNLTASKSLQDCAMTYLGYRVDAMSVHAQPLEGQASDDMRQLALRLLERALPLYREASTMPRRYPSSVHDNFVGSH